MTEFELLAIPLSLVLGLGVTRILGAVTAAIRARDTARLHWLPLTWAFLIFAHQVQYFFVLWDINEDLVSTGGSWTWPWFGPAFFHVVLFYLAAGLILPKRPEDAGSLLGDFARHGRLALLPLLVAYLVSPPLNVYQHHVGWGDISNALNFPLIATSGVVFWRKGKGKVVMIATVVHAAVELLGFATVWSHPGSS